MSSLSIHYRLAVASRALAGVAGGYALTSSIIAALALLLPLQRVEATVAATMLSFAIYAGAVVWAFAARTAWRAWAGIAVPLITLQGLLWLRQLLTYA